MPAGSIRALLALTILGTTAALITLRPATTIIDAFRDLTFLILGHYFALRRGAGEPVQVGPAPLFLPRGTVRFLIFVGFGAVIGLLIYRGEPLNPQQTPAIYTLIVVAGFLLGVVASTIVRWLWERGHRPKRLWADLRAFLTILAAAALIILAWNEAYHFLPDPRSDGRVFPITPEGVRHTLAAIVAFYFGVRS
jgi:hypothetical protein